MSLTNQHETMGPDGVTPKAINQMLGKDSSRENLFGEGWQGVKRSFDLGILSFGYLLVGIFYMIKGFPSYVDNRFIKKKKPGIILSELPWKDHSGLNVGYHFPSLGEKERMLQIVNHETSEHKTGLHRTNAKHPGITTVKTNKTYEDVMAEKDPEDDVYHFGTGNDGKEIVR